MKKTIFKKNKIKGLMFLFLFLISLLMMNQISMTNNKNLDNPFKNDINEEDDYNVVEVPPKTSISFSNYEWWNNDWEFRVSVNVSANDAEQNNVPVELIVNFSELIEDPELNYENFQLNSDSIRVIESKSPSVSMAIPCQFDKYSTYDNHSNAIGEVVWIMNGTTAAVEIRQYFIYFDNGTDPSITWPYTQKIRIWHEGFEDNFDKNTLARLQPGSQDRDANSHWVVDNVAARGDKSYLIMGNCWKAHQISTINVGGQPYTATAKMRFDDPTPNKDISGIGFWNTYTGPLNYDSYEIRGVQNWGRAGWTGSESKFRNDYYLPSETFFWYTFNLDSELSTNSINYIVHIADDDNDYGGFFNFSLYWDDISIWNQSVQTVPDHIISTSIGEIEPISYSLKLTCKDVDDNIVPDAQVYVTNSTFPYLNKQGISDDDGIVFFSNMSRFKWYDITVNYTQQGNLNPKTETVNFTSIFITQLNTEITLSLDIWTMNFTVYDVDEEPIRYGYIEINDGFEDIGKAYFDNMGNCTLRWKNTTSYSYNAYFDYTLLTDDSSYRYPKILIESNTINRPSNYQRVDTLISKVNFSVKDQNNDDFENCVLRIYNQSDYQPDSAAVGEIIANLTCDENGNATLYAFNDETPAPSWGDYTIEFYFAGLLWHITANVFKNDNFTLNREMYLPYKVLLTRDNYISNFTLLFTNPSDLSNEVTWREEITFQYNFTVTDQAGAITNQATPDEVFYQIFSAEGVQLSDKISVSFIEVSAGIINITLNTSRIGLIGGKSYFLELSATKQGYQPPEFEKEFIYVIALPAELTIHEYGGLYTEISDVSEFYDEFLNISLRYYYTATGESLKGATLRYNWQHGSGDINPDPLNNDYYTFTIDTSDVVTIGSYIFTIDANLDNYTYIGAQPLNLHVLGRKTSLNNEADPFDKSYNIYVQDAINFTYILKDLDRDEVLGDLSEAYYTWYRSISGVWSEQSDIVNLVESVNNSYILDFDTEAKQIGTYLLRLKLGKTNYETKDLDITLNILKREIDADLDAKGLDDDQLNIVKGKTVTITIELTDPTQGDIPITGAKVVLEIGDKEFEFDEEDDGVYELKFSTEDYEAFFTSQTLTGEIIIKKANYETEEIDITIVIEMEEITPGVPTFYFIMVVGAVAAVVSSLITYRVIQLARIPKFIKKARAMKKAIKGRGEIPDSALTSSKEEMILKQFGDDWKELGISLGDTLGIKPKKGKILSESKESMKNEGGVK